MVSSDELDSPKTIWILLAELAKKQSDWTILSRDNARRIANEVKRQFTPVSYERLNNARKDDYSVFGQTFLHLPPDDKGGWKQPILRAVFETKDQDRGNEHRVFRVKTAILVEDREVKANGVENVVHRGIGLRFESQEGPAGKSIHDYAHAQLFCAFDRESLNLPSCPAWLPDVHPAIPIPAENAVDILCCALKSLYGARSEPLRWLAETLKKPAYCRSLGAATKRLVNCWADLA